MEISEVLVFAASRTRARLTLVATLGVITVILAALQTNWTGIGIILAFTILAYLVPLFQGKVLRKVFVGKETVTFEFAAFGTPFSRSEPRTTVAGVYTTKVGPKGITLRVLQLTATAANELIAEVQPDLTGWKEQDLLALAAVLSKPSYEQLGTSS